MNYFPDLWNNLLQKLSFFLIKSGSLNIRSISLRISKTDLYLSYGFLLQAFIIIFSIITGVLGLYFLTLGNFSLMCFKATVTALSSSKGTRPVISSKNVIPNEYISDCGVA